MSKVARCISKETGIPLHEINNMCADDLVMRKEVKRNQLTFFTF